MREGQRGGVLEGGGAGEPAAGRNVAFNEQIAACEARAALAEQGGDAGDVRGPVRPVLGLPVVDRPALLVIEFGRVGANSVVLAPGGGDPGLLLGRDREDEAVVVVGVLADQVDAPGGLGDHGTGLFEASGETVAYFTATHCRVITRGSYVEAHGTNTTQLTGAVPKPEARACFSIRGAWPRCA